MNTEILQFGIIILLAIATIAAALYYQKLTSQKHR